MSIALRSFHGVLGVLCVLSSGCFAPLRPIPTLATARTVTDFDTYELSRVGILPLAGVDLSNARSHELQSALTSELSAVSRIEWIALAEADLAEVPDIDAHRRGGWDPKSILALARRHNLDGILICTVTDHKEYPPLRLGLQTVLVSSETGMALWQASVVIDAGNASVRDAIEIWARRSLGDVGRDTWEVVLLSPQRFGQFGAYQLAARF